MAEENKSEKPAPIVPMATGDFISVLVLGGAIGLIIWGIGLLLNMFVFESYLCQDGAGDQCDNAKNYAAIVATIIGGAGALAGLVRLRVYRPLLVFIAAAVSTWGVVQTSWGMAWYVGVLVAVVLYTIAIGAFSWLARIREFWISLAVIAVLTAIVRLILTT